MDKLITSTGKMTSLAISKITGKNHGHLMRDIRKMEETWVGLGQSKFGLSSYINEQNRAMPMYELSKTECLYIATKFNDEARAKLVLRWEELEKEKQQTKSPAEIALYHAKLLVEQEKKINEHDQRLKELEAKAVTKPEYYTVAGYGSLNGVAVNIKLASSLGRKASKICKDNDIPTDSIPDPRFGTVKMYPKQILEQVFNQQL